MLQLLVLIATICLSAYSKAQPMKVKQPFSAENNGYKPVFEDRFEAPTLNRQNWLPFYLPQWSSREASKPNYRLKDGFLHLQITKNQQPWCPEFNGGVKCSSLQTGVFSGPLGSAIGQHSFFNPQCKVREAQKPQKLFVPHYGYFEMRARFAASKNNVAALWMIGFEDEPERSSELCIMEIKGWNVKKKSSVIGMGFHNFNDPNLEEAFFEDEFSIDVTDFHVYAAEWLPGKTIFYIDGAPVREIAQAPNYPMQFMLGIYEIPEQKTDKKHSFYPQEFSIDYVKGYQKKSK